jgi:hypothetical protein
VYVRVRGWGCGSLTEEEVLAATEQMKARFDDCDDIGELK